MTRRNATRSVLVTLSLTGLAACIVNLSFAMDKQVLLQSQGGATSVAQTVAVKLSDYSEITDHKQNIKSLDLDYVDVTILSVNPGNTAHTVSGTVSLRQNPGDPPANDIPVGTITSLALQPQKTVRIAGTPTLDAFLLQQLQTSGTFYVVVNGNIDSGVADVTVDLNMHASIGYDAGLF